MMTLLVQYGAYHCAECLKPLDFETVGEWGNQMHPSGYGIGYCRTSSCDRHGVRLKVPLTTIEVETLPTEDNPHEAQTTAIGVRDDAEPGRPPE